MNNDVLTRWLERLLLAPIVAAVALALLAEVWNAVVGIFGGGGARSGEPPQGESPAPRVEGGEGKEERP